MTYSKDKGTKAETAFVRYAQARTGDDRIMRTALHGKSDHGDITGIFAHGWRGGAEVKNYRGNPSRSQLERWKAETEREMRNADRDFMLLVVHEVGKNMEDPASPTYPENRVYMTLDSLLKVANVTARTYSADVMECWVQLTVGQVFDLITNGV